MYPVKLKAHIGVPLKMLVNEPERCNRRDKGKGPGDNPSYLYTASV